MAWSNAYVFLNFEEKKSGRGKKRRTATDSPDGKVWLLEYLTTVNLLSLAVMF